MAPTGKAGSVSNTSHQSTSTSSNSTTNPERRPRPKTRPGSNNPAGSARTASKPREQSAGPSTSRPPNARDSSKSDQSPDSIDLLRYTRSEGGSSIGWEDQSLRGSTTTSQLYGEMRTQAEERRNQKEEQPILYFEPPSSSSGSLEGSGKGKGVDMAAGSERSETDSKFSLGGLWNRVRDEEDALSKIRDRIVDGAEKDKVVLYFAALNTAYDLHRFTLEALVEEVKTAREVYEGHESHIAPALVTAKKQQEAAQTELNKVKNSKYASEKNKAEAGLKRAKRELEALGENSRVLEKAAKNARQLLDDYTKTHTTAAKKCYDTYLDQWKTLDKKMGRGGASSSGSAKSTMSSLQSSGKVDVQVAKKMSRPQVGRTELQAGWPSAPGSGRS